MSDYGPEFDAYAARVRREVVPKIKDSQLFIAITPSNPKKLDIRFAVELGIAIMLDKPIVAVVAPGAEVSEKLARVTDRFVELDLEDPACWQRLEDTIEELLASSGAEGPGNPDGGSEEKT